MNKLNKVINVIVIFLILVICTLIIHFFLKTSSPSTTPTQNQVPTSNSETVQSVNNEQPIQISLSFNGGEAQVSLEDNPTTQSLLAQLPATIEVQDFSNAEKLLYLPEDLSTEGAPSGYDPQVGDFACYGPWGNIAIYYKDQPYASGIIPMGKVTSGIDELSSLEEGQEVTITLVE